MNTKYPRPFQMVKTMPQKAWTLCDTCMEVKEQLHWHDYCILPIAAGMSVAKELGFSMENGYRISALYAWRKYKEIYSFNDDLADMLIEQADEDMDIPIDILFQLPYPCVYIEFKGHGFFAHFEHDVNNGQIEFRMWYFESDDDATGFPLILHVEEQCTISEAMDKTIDEAKQRMSPDQEFGVMQYLDNMKHKAAELLQFVLYICAENSEKEENPEQKKTTRRTHESEKAPKDVYREIQKWDVGFRIGSKIHRMKQESSESDRNSAEYWKGGKKSPHSRRGHWHHYWVGKHNTDDRRLILKWVSPMFIGGDEDDNITTIHPVE